MKSLKETGKAPLAQPEQVESDENLKQNRSDGVKGFKKLENISHIAATLQCLSNIPSLRQYYVSSKFKSDLNFSAHNNTNNLTRVFARVLRSIWSSNKKSVSLANLKKLIDSFPSSTELLKSNDPYHFFTYFISWLYEDLKTGEKKWQQTDQHAFYQVKRASQAIGILKWISFTNEKSNEISRLFHFMNCSVWFCSACNYSWPSFEIINSCLLEIPLLKDVNKQLINLRLLAEPRNYLTIDDCLEELMRTRMLNDQVKCENCSNTRDIIRQKYFFNLPKIMVFALDRFDDNHEFFVDKSVRFPMTFDYYLRMDLSNYLCSNNNKNSTFYELIAVLDAQQMPTTSSSAVNFQRHYTAYAKNDSTQNWYHFDNENVCQADPKDFQTKCCACILVYQRRDEAVETNKPSAHAATKKQDKMWPPAIVREVNKNEENKKDKHDGLSSTSNAIESSLEQALDESDSSEDEDDDEDDGEEDLLGMSTFSIKHVYCTLERLRYLLSAKNYTMQMFIFFSILILLMVKFWTER